jgi:hypothetical protein
MPNLTVSINIKNYCSKTNTLSKQRLYKWGAASCLNKKATPARWNTLTAYACPNDNKWVVGGTPSPIPLPLSSIWIVIEFGIGGTWSDSRSNLLRIRIQSILFNRRRPLRHWGRCGRLILLASEVSRRSLRIVGIKLTCYVKWVAAIRIHVLNTIEWINRVKDLPRQRQTYFERIVVD